jgi:hypothetical protein
MEIRRDQQEIKYPDSLKGGDKLFGPRKEIFENSTAQRFSSSNDNLQYSVCAAPVD